MNPSQSKVVSANQTPLPNNNNSNNPVAYNPQGYNTFDRSAPHLSTYRFAEVAPFYCTPEIEGNVARIRTAHDLRTESLSSVLFSSVKMDKSFYQIPWSAIAPHSWEYLYRQPIKGDDIDFLSVFQNVDLKTLLDFSKSFVTRLRSMTVPGANTSLINYFREYIPIVLMLNLIHGNSSLFHRLGTTIPNEDLIDDLKSNLVNSIYLAVKAGMMFRFVDPDGNIHVLTDLSFEDSSSSSSQFSLSKVYQWLEDLEFYSMYLAPLINSTATFNISYTDLSSPPDVTLTSYSEFEGFEFVEDMIYIIQNTENQFISISSSEHSVPINLMPCIAYQQLCYQYYSNSAVDDVYTGAQYLENLLSLCHSCNESGNPFYYIAQSKGWTSSSAVIPFKEYFTINGVRVFYDALSGQFMNNFLTASPSYTVAFGYLAFFASFLSIQRSLKYGDYFVSGRTHPISVGSSEISVVNDSVNVVDVNRSLWIQRFRHAVNRIPQTISEYLRQLTGVEPERLAPKPNWICTESYVIGGMEVENTADNQGKVTTLLRSDESRYMYEVFIDEPSFIIGVRSFVAQNIYPKSSSKISFMSDRLDWFNHFAQHFGDESVELRELESPLKSELFNNTPISYQVRYSGFKYNIPRASGAFSKGLLPSWAIMPRYLNNRYAVDSGNIPVMSSYFIRNVNEDFDVLFAHMLGTNNASRYHFEISDYIDDKVNSRQAKFPSLDV